MMDNRRGFLALVDGTALSGIVHPDRAAQRPVLLLPPPATIPPALAVLPLLAAEKTHMHAFIHVRAGLPDYAFEAWLEQGLGWRRGAGRAWKHDAPLCGTRTNRRATQAAGTRTAAPPARSE